MALARHVTAFAKTHEGKRITQVVLSVPLPGRFWICETTNGGKITVHENFLTEMPVIPSRFRQAAFDRFAHVIGAALRAFPNAIQVDPAPLRMESFTQPLRDAIRAKATYGYRHPHIDDELFDRHHKELIVSGGPDGFVYVGSKAAVAARRCSSTVGNPAGQHPMNGYQFNFSTVEQLENLCSLLHNRHFRPQPFFTVSGVSEKVVQDLESRYDVAFVPVEDKANTYSLMGPIEIENAL